MQYILQPVLNTFVDETILVEVKRFKFGEYFAVFL